MQSRNTKTKLCVIEQFTQSTLPLTIQHVYQTVKKDHPSIAYSTVFRIVRDLPKQKKLTQIDWRERGNLFEWSGRAHHHHIVCNTCSNVTDVTEEELHINLQTIAKKTGYTILDHSIELFGVCSPCQQKQL